MNQRGFDQARQGFGDSWIPVKMAGQRSVFEYVLSLRIKMLQGNYADFIRGLTPVVVDLFAMCLKSELQIELEEFCELDKNGVWKISDHKMSTSKYGKDIKKALQNQSQSMEIKYGPLGSVHILYIFRELSQNTKLVDRWNLFEKLRQVSEILPHMKLFP